MTATGAQLRGRPGPAAALGIPKSIQTQVLMGRPRAPQVPAAPGSSPPRPLAKVMHSGVGCRRRFQRRPSTEGAKMPAEAADESCATGAADRRVAGGCLR